MKPGSPEFRVSQPFFGGITKDGMDLWADVRGVTYIPYRAEINNHGKPFHQQLISCFSLTPGTSCVSITELTLDRRIKPREFVLYQKVVYAALQRGNCRLFANGARNDNKRDIQSAVFQRRESCQGAKLRHGVIGEDDIPPLT
jgi:hypothetical protein